ncbi:TPA: hypothetical protein DEP31_02495 [Candidatus Azambacteria bacterium]|nr:hypothetical protein [Candidatus Azambacteria bacterium]HCB36315.1 hypothetical protein [Candidatus Azambacteria bacterium]
MFLGVWRIIKTMTANKQKIVIFVMGRPGSGKDTQADFLAKRFNLLKIVTSDLLQEKFKKSPTEPTVQKEKEIFEKGVLNTPSWVVSAVKEKISELTAGGLEGRDGIIFAGSPRTLYEAENLVPFLENVFGTDNLKAVYLETTAEEAIKRISLRAARALDRDPEKLKVRMTEYEERTMPVLDYFNQRNILIKVDGMPAQEIVFEDILLKLEGLEK